MKIELNTGGRSAGKTLITIRRNFDFTEEVKAEDLKTENPFLQALTKNCMASCIDLKNTVAGRLMQKNQHQKKVIDRLSRKIQKLTKKNRINEGWKEHYKNLCCLSYGGVRYTRTIDKLEAENRFLKKRENKLQMIEQMFKNGVVDLRELDKLVRGTK